MEQRIEYIDIAKGVAIILVVIGHVLCYDLYGFAEAEKSELFNFIYSFHMPLFFFLSGLVSKTDLKWKEMPADLWKRFRSLMVPFFVVGGIFSLWNAGNFGFLFHSAKWGYWYLWVLFVYYVICYPISKIAKGNVGLVCQVVVSIVVWYVLLKLFEYASPKQVSTFSLYIVFYNFPFFVIGRFIKQLNLQKLAFENVYVLVAATTVWMFSNYLIFPFSEYIIATSSILVVVNICNKFGKISQSVVKNILAYLGKNSLYIYVFHIFIVELFVTGCFKDWLIKYSNFGIDLLLSFVPTMLVVVGALAIKFVLEREPVIMKFIFNKEKE